MIRLLNRVAAMLRNGSAPRPSSASTGLLMTMIVRTPIIVRQLAAVSGIRMTTVSTCWMSVFARAMSWPVWALVVEREVQPLEMGEQPLAQVGLGAERDAERGVAAHAGGDRLHDRRQPP